MTIPTFTPPRLPDMGTGGKFKTKILKADFGDGYTQSAADGVNYIRRTVTLSWEVLTPTEIATMNAFFVAQGGWNQFWWTPTDESTPVKWTCEEWDIKGTNSGLRTWSAVFVQSFNLTT